MPATANPERPAAVLVGVDLGASHFDRELEELLAASNQHLAFEPPRYGSGSTIGGVVAAGLSGPARASVGALRDCTRA